MVAEHTASVLELLLAHFTAGEALPENVERYAARRRLCCSLPRPTEPAHELTRSQNVTVSSRRSASERFEADWGYGSAGGVGSDDVLRRASASGLSGCPHWPQNFAVRGLRDPHAEQDAGSGAPHSVQNFASSTTAAPQPGHCTAIVHSSGC